MTGDGLENLVVGDLVVGDLVGLGDYCLGLGGFVGFDGPTVSQLSLQLVSDRLGPS